MLPVSDAWRPTVLSGSFEKGYVRLEDGIGILQIRWQTARQSPDLRARVSSYLTLLEKSARKQKKAIQFKQENAAFRWHGDAKGYGAALWDERHGRVFLVERSGPSDVSFKREAKEQIEGLTFPDGEFLPWEVLGLRIRLPKTFRFHRWDPLAGRIRLTFRSRLSTLTAERWSLADRLLREGSLVDWARQAIGGNPTQAAAGGVGVENGRLIRESCLAVHQPDRNQILVLRERGIRRLLDLNECLP